MSIKLQLPKLTDLKPRITVIGVGGAGGNAVNNMIAAGLDGVEFIVANTDAQALAASSAEQRIQLGVEPDRGPRRRLQARDRRGRRRGGDRGHPHGRSPAAHMVFIAAGMGGGTGTGAASVIARVAKEFGILTVGVVTKPFQFEGSRRMRMAEAGIAELRKHVDTLIVIPNQNLFRVATDHTTFAEAFVLADQVLYSGVACIVDLIVKEGLINLDFADVSTVMSGMGIGHDGHGRSIRRAARHRCRRGGDRQSAARRRHAEGRQEPAAVDHRRPRPDAVGGGRGGQPRAPGGRSGRQHHRRRHLRRVAGRQGARVDRGLGHGAPASTLQAPMPPPADPRQRTMRRKQRAPPRRSVRAAPRLSASACSTQRPDDLQRRQRSYRSERRERRAKRTRRSSARRGARPATSSSRRASRNLWTPLNATRAPARRSEGQCYRAIHAGAAGRSAARRAPHAGCRGFPAGGAARVSRQGRLCRRKGLRHQAAQ